MVTTRVFSKEMFANKKQQTTIYFQNFIEEKGKIICLVTEEVNYLDVHGS